MARGDGQRVSGSGARAGTESLQCGVASLVCAILLGAMAGCPPKAVRVDDGVDAANARAEAQAALEAADRAEAERFIAACVAAQNERAEKLASFEAFAAVRLRYTDADGQQEDQLDGAIYLAPGNKGAFDLKLLGQRWAWLGGDGAQSWVYLAPPKRPSVLHVYEKLVDGAATDAEDVVGSAELTLLTPASLRLLLGIGPIGRDAETVPVTAERGGVHERFAARFQPSRSTVAEIQFAADGLPRLVVVRMRDGTEVVRASLGRFERVRLSDVAVGAWPSVATSVVMEAARSKAGATILIDKERLVESKRRARPQFFDLGDLQAYLMPSEVVVHAAEAVGAGGP